MKRIKWTTSKYCADTEHKAWIEGVELTVWEVGNFIRRYTSHADCGDGYSETKQAHKTLAEAKRDAIRLGRELVEDTVRGAMLLAATWDIDVEEIA